MVAFAASWLENQSLETTSYLAERIAALSSSGADSDVLLSYLDEVSHACDPMSPFKTEERSISLEEEQCVGPADLTG